MAESGRESGEASQVDWSSLETELSAGALESLREHLQQYVRQINDEGGRQQQWIGGLFLDLSRGGISRSTPSPMHHHHAPYSSAGQEDLIGTAAIPKQTVGVAALEPCCRYFSRQMVVN